MSSNSNLTSMRRTVEQLKLEASIERIKLAKFFLASHGCPRLQQNSNSTAFRMPPKMPSWSACQQAVIPSENLGPACSSRCQVSSSSENTPRDHAVDGPMDMYPHPNWDTHAAQACFYVLFLFVCFLRNYYLFVNFDHLELCSLLYCPCVTVNVLV